MTEQRSSRVMIIGLDGATWNVLTPWITDGSLPHLARLRQSGCWGDLLSTIPPLTAPAWSSFMTGKNPGKHGVFHFIDLFGNNRETDAKPDIVDGRSIKSSTLWDILGHHGRKVGLINVPMTYPPRPVNGFMITGLLTPASASIFTYPPELSRQLTDYQIDLERFIDHKPFDRDSDAPRSVEPSLGLMQEFCDMLEKRAKTSLSLTTSEPWDTFMVVFAGTDRIGHYLWPYHHTQDMDDTPGSQRLYEAVHAYYIRLDEIIGELVEQAGQDTVVILMSDHGMGPRPIKLVHWNNWLRQQGLLSVKTDGGNLTNPDDWLARLGLPRDKIGRAIRRIPWLFKSRLVQKARTSSTAATIDMDRTKAYHIPMFDVTCGIRINLKDEERDILREELMQAVQQALDPTTGQPVVRRVYRGKGYYSGPYASNVPDIILVMAPEYVGTSRLSHYSSVVTERVEPGISGTHQMEGIFLASGPAIVSRSEALQDLDIKDIAPTVLHLLGLPVPSDLDGRVLTEILAPAVLQAHPITQGPPLGTWPTGEEVTFDDQVLAPEDEELIRERLHALGYFD